MLQAILKQLQKIPANTNTNDIITSEGVEALSDTPLSNDLVLEMITSFMADSHNSFIQILYYIIKENPYAIFLFIVISVFILTIILRLILYIISHHPKNMKKHLGRRLLNILLSSHFIWTGLLLGVVVGVDVLQIPDVLAHLIKGCALSILLWMFYMITQKLITLYARAILIYRAHGSRIKFFKNKNILIVLSRSIHAIWFLLFVTILLGLWGVELAPILTGLGIVGIVVGLALQDSLSHIMGGISLMLDETYTEGDYIILENDNAGIIFQIGYRSTKLRTFDEEIITIPNGILSKMIITNLSQPVKRSRVTLFLKTYAADASPQLVKELLIQTAKSSSGILRYPEPTSFFLAPEGSLYSFRVSFYISTPLNKLSASDTVQQEIVRVFNQHNIRFGITENVMHVQEHNITTTSDK
ncbi:MAG: mechanosensitive ion channel family protein [Brevinema sp.]